MKKLTKNFSTKLSLSENENHWQNLFEIDELFNSILSFLPISSILIQSSLVSHKWYDKINREDIHSLWPYLMDSIWSFISELVPTNHVYIYNKSINCEQNERYHDDPNHSLSKEDVKLRDEFKINLQKQLEMYFKNCAQLRSRRQLSLIISNYIFSINRCSLLVDKKSTFMEPHWIRSLSNQFSVSIPQFLKIDLKIAQKKGICSDWSEITMSNWFFSMGDIELKMDSILLSKRKDNCWTIIHSESFQKGRKTLANNSDSSPVDQRKDWNFLSNAKKKTIKNGQDSDEDGEASSGSNGSSNEEEIITDIWKKIRMKRASKSLISTFEGRFKPMWIQPKFIKQSNTNYFEIPQPLEPTPKKNFKVLNHIVSRWIYELDKYNLLNIEFVLIHTMRVLYYLYNGCVLSDSHSLMVGSPQIVENSLEKHLLKRVRTWKKTNERKNFKNYYSSLFLNTSKEKLKSLYCLSVCHESLIDEIGSLTEEQEPFSFEFSEYQL